MKAISVAAHAVAAQKIEKSANHIPAHVTASATLCPRIDLNDEAVQRGVQIDVLLEASTAHGGKVDHDSAEAMRKLAPPARLFAWSAHDKGAAGQYPGVVHAKCAVADGRVAFITSANLTSAAMERNMELGVLVTGGNLPEELHNHLEALIVTKVLEPVQPAT